MELQDRIRVCSRWRCGQCGSLSEAPLVHCHRGIRPDRLSRCWGGRNRPGLKVGLASEILNARRSPTALLRANYLTAVASRIDSLWVPDHLNSLMPRALAT